MNYPHISVSLPEWVAPFLAEQPTHYPTLEARMGLVIELARRNSAENSGGPFAAAIFDMRDGRLVAPGVNRVVPTRCAIAHAEMVAIALAGQLLGNHDLGAPDMPPYELVASTEPCAMCFGAVPWSGVRHLVCGARDEDARAIGFDEGPKMAHWPETLEERGIRVTRDICREEAAQVLRDYKQQGGPIYNARQGSEE
jgi:tRNA(Arg) A34 adenosine deaminase TadA